MLQITSWLTSSEYCSAKQKSIFKKNIQLYNGYREFHENYNSENSYHSLSGDHHQS